MIDEEKMRCPECGATGDDVSLVDENGIHCHECNQETGWLCECGHSNKDDESNCTECLLKDPQED